MVFDKNTQANITTSIDLNPKDAASTGELQRGFLQHVFTLINFQIKFLLQQPFCVDIYGNKTALF